MEVSVLNIKGQDTGRKVVLDDAVYGIEPNDHAIYLDVKLFLANQRQGTAKSKERSEISGSLTLVSQILLNVEIDDVIIGLNTEDGLIQSHLTAGLLTFDIQYTDFHLTC